MTVRDCIEFALAMGLGGFLYLWLEARQDLRNLQGSMPKRDGKGRFQKRQPAIQDPVGIPYGVTWSSPVLTLNSKGGWEVRPENQ